MREQCEAGHELHGDDPCTTCGSGPDDRCAAATLANKPRGGATITMQDMVRYYDGILANGKDLSEITRRHLTEVRDKTAAGTLAIPSQERA